jgi:hypothetical protein
MNHPPSSFSLDTTIPIVHASSALASMPIPQAIQDIPGGSVRSLPYPEMLSWSGRYQSQEAVIEAVGGG